MKTAEPTPITGPEFIGLDVDMCIRRVCYRGLRDGVRVRKLAVSPHNWDELAGTVDRYSRGGRIETGSEYGTIVLVVGGFNVDVIPSDVCGDDHVFILVDKS